MKGYHFTSDKLRNDDPLPPIGEWLEYKGEIVPCKSGLHASIHPLDALQYAQGCLLHRVELDGELQPHGDPPDKYVGRRRKIIATIDATELLKAFAHWCALQVIDLWDAPVVVREYLETGDESKREAAWDAAWAMAGAMSPETAWEAARVAAWAAAGAAAWDAAWAAARATIQDTAWIVARNAQRAKFAVLVNKAFAK